MSAKSEEFEYVWDFQVPGSKPGMSRKTPRTSDSCKLKLTPFQPHTFDSIAAMMDNRETSPFTSCPYIMCACCNDHKFWLWVQPRDLKNLKIAICVHTVMQ